MRKLLLFIILLSNTPLMAQNLDTLWENIEPKFRQGEFKSLLPQIEKAKQLAKEQGNMPMVAKALFYEAQIKINTSDAEDNVNPVFNSFKKEEISPSGVEKAIWNVYLAKLYQMYLNDYKWQIVNRTNLEQQSSEDIRFWTENDFNAKITNLYQDILSSKGILLKEPSERWIGLFAISKDSKELQKYVDLTPTLYDVFSHYALDFSFDKDKLKELAAINLSDGNINAYLFNQQRLLKETSKETFTEKIEALAVQYPQAWYTAELYLILAREYYNQGAAGYKRVFQIDEKLKTLFKDTDASKTVSSLSESIKAVSFSVETESYIPVNQNTPIRISHRNISKLYVKVLDYNMGIQDINLADVSRALNNAYKDSEERYTSFLKKHKTVQEYAIDLKSFDDYLEHSSLFNLNPLPKGRYIVIFSEEKDFKYNAASESKYFEIKVSESVVEYTADDTFRVRNRLSGKPVTGAKIEVYKANQNQNSYSLVNTLTTNSKGEIKFDKQRQFVYRLAGENVFYGEIYRYNRYQPENEKEFTSTKFFTDRAIYRPGQTVYFKGIVMSSEDKKVKVVPNSKVDVLLRDVNYNVISTLNLVTNEFGSVHGEFVLPVSGLTGTFEISSSKSGTHFIQVEEYKRPKFQVEIEKPSGVFSLNDSLSLIGSATAFSGANTDGAQVEYRVYRQAIYPFRYWGYRPVAEKEEQVAFGSTETDQNGKFSVRFKAVPGREQKDKNDIRTYTYRIEANVTDINGETQTGLGDVQVGDRRVLLSSKLDERTDVKSLEKFKIFVKNLNGKDLEKKGKLKLVALKSPERVLRKQNYVTDYNFYSKAEFVKLFPNQAYGDESNPENWESGATVFSVDFDTKESSDIAISNAGKLKEGYYKLIMTAEDGEFTVENAQLVYLINDKVTSKTTEILNYKLNKTAFKPNEVAKLSVNTGAGALYLDIKVEANGTVVREETLLLNDKQKQIEIPIKEIDKGGVFVHYKYVRYNTSEQGTINIPVPFDDKKLEISTAVTRDKLVPGANEKWQFTVKGDEVTEVLAGMYDASLDQFAANSFDYFAYNFSNYAKHSFGYYNYGFQNASVRNITWKNSSPNFGKEYQPLHLNTHNFMFEGRRTVRLSGAVSRMNAAPAMAEDALAEVTVGGGVNLEKMESSKEENHDAVPQEPDLSKVQVRRALQETAFFYPTLRTDKEGNVAFEFTVPESLTEWKLMTFAHTPDLKTGYLEKRVKTQKDLMVIPNVPRFLREGDKLILSTKIVNLSENALNGNARLALTDAISGKSLDVVFKNEANTKSFSAAKGESGEVSWEISVPENVQAVSYTIVASAGGFSDGEESVIPVVTNRMLVTETLPISVRENQTKNYTFDKLVKGKTGENFKLTLEMTSNPIWYAIFSLPYLREYPYECSEQVFSRLYGNLISENIISSQPKIKAVFDDWNRKGELKSKLELNQELKNILLEETPWVRDAVSEEEQMKRIAVLFDLNTMKNELQSAFSKLSQKQTQSGGFAWFDGGRENEYITTHIVSGFGNLKNMKIDFEKQGIDASDLIRKAIAFIDQKQVEYYTKQKELKQSDLDYNSGINYLYARSFFLEEYPLPKSLDSLKNIYLQNIQKENLSLQAQGMGALILHRFNKKEEAKKIVKSIKERSTASDEMGMYWKNNQTGWYWYQAPVETQSILIEAFNEVTQDTDAVEAMKVWLLKNRQTNQWNSTKATTKAVYALMNTGKSWIDAEKGVKVKLGTEQLNLEQPTAQAGSGYVKMTWNKEEIKPEMGKVEVQKTSPGVAWGAVYWQYFEDLDKITSAQTGIKFNKKLYLKVNTANGPVLKEITQETPIKVGDLVTVRLEISIDRNMEFVHIKDMRASGFEPVNVLSGYKWKDGFGYYESTRDLATNFFADYIQKGTYVFEYTLKANNAGNFSNGITQMQNMYAPELSAHSEGIRVDIK